MIRRVESNKRATAAKRVDFRDLWVHYYIQEMFFGIKRYNSSEMTRQDIFETCKTRVR